jgi:polysaccharide biosynthesis/export protein
VNGHMNHLQHRFSIAMLLFVSACSWAQQSYNSASPRVSTVPTTAPAAATAETTVVTSTSMSPLSTTMTAAPVHISPGDLLEIGVFDTPELAGKVRVNSDGDITLPLVGALHIGGLSPEQVESLLASSLHDENFVKDAQVSVFVAEYASQAVYVLGEVVKPGPYPLMGSHRLLDFISAAGGFTPRAGKTITLKTSADPDHPKTIGPASAEKDLNPEIAAGDSILISQAGIVYVLGDVNRPGGFMLDRQDSLTIIQALALAEGTVSTAAQSSAKLIRTTANGRQEIPVNLKAILKSKNTDLAMQSNDILFVPGSTVKGVLKNAESLAPVAASALIYRIP